MSAEKIAQDLLDAQERVVALTADMQQASEDRDRLIVIARKTGMGATEISRLISVHRTRVYKILERAGLRP